MHRLQFSSRLPITTFKNPDLLSSSLASTDIFVWNVDKCGKKVAELATVGRRLLTANVQTGPGGPAVSQTSPTGQQKKTNLDFYTCAEVDEVSVTCNYRPITNLPKIKWIGADLS